MLVQLFGSAVFGVDDPFDYPRSKHRQRHWLSFGGFAR